MSIFQDKENLTQNSLDLVIIIIILHFKQYKNIPNIQVQLVTFGHYDHTHNNNIDLRWVKYNKYNKNIISYLYKFSSGTSSWADVLQPPMQECACSLVVVLRHSGKEHL